MVLRTIAVHTAAARNAGRVPSAQAEVAPLGVRALALGTLAPIEAREVTDAKVRFAEARAYENSGNSAVLLNGNRWLSAVSATPKYLRKALWMCFG